MANIEDIQVVIDTFYQMISGRAGEERDWEAFKGLFATGAQLLNVTKNTVPSDVDTYTLKLNDFLLKEDFYEYGFDYAIEIYGSIAQAYSKYEAKRTEESTKIVKQGTNLVQLIHNGDGWKIISMLWEDESV